MNNENIIWVDDDFPYPEKSTGSITKPYKYISSAINNAVDGDTIIVLSGFYDEDLIIDKSISIISENVNTTIIESSSNNPYIIKFTSNSASLEGFTILSTTDSRYRREIMYLTEGADNILISNNKIKNTSNILGISLNGVDNSIIRNNSINDTKGLQIKDSNNNYIYNNSLWDCSNGALISLISSKNNFISNNILNNSLNGIYLFNTSNTMIDRNKFSRNDIYCLGVFSGFGNRIENNSFNYSSIGIKTDSNSYSNLISNNYLKNCNIGISLDSSECIVSKNFVISSSMYCIYADDISSDNTIFNNNFSSTSYYCLGREEGHNNWYNDFVGNYWSNYFGPDNDGDGIGDLVYQKGNVYDLYPKGVFNELPRIMNNSPADMENGTDIRPTLSVKVIDPEDENMDVYFYYIINETSFLIDVVSNVLSNSTVSIPFYSAIEGKNAVYSYEGHGYDYICVWYVIVKDQYSSNKSDEWLFTTKRVPINNEKPYAYSGGSYEGVIGETINFDGSGCYDSDGDIEFYRWSFGDGDCISQIISPKHVYKNPGTYTVSLKIVDDGGRINTSSSQVEILSFSTINELPVSEINGPYFFNNTDEILFNASNSIDLDGKIVNFTWDFGDGYIGYGSSVSHNYTRYGKYKVVLTVVDNDGGINSTFVSVDFRSTTSSYKIFIFDNLQIISFVLIIVAVVICFLVWRFYKK